MMSRGTLFAAAVMLLSSLPSEAQQRPPNNPLDQPARLTLVDVPLGRALERLSQTSGAAIAFSPEVVAGFQTSCDCDPQTVEAALNIMLRGTGLRFDVRGRQIVVFAPSLRLSGALQGRVRGPDGAPLIGALVELYPAEADKPVRTVETDGVGRYRAVGLAPGLYRVVVAALGYDAHEQPTDITGGELPDRLDVALEIMPLALEGVSVEGERSRARARFEREPGVTSVAVTGHDIRFMPSIGEPDPLRIVESLPGVTSTSDFTASYNVRGGAADQNLILLDGIPIFNPFHMAGFFSVFNSDMIEQTEVRAGGFSAEYGGRVSSVLSVETDPGNGDFDIRGGVSLLAARLAVSGGLPQGTLGFEQARWRIGGRRSYVDQVSRPWVRSPYHIEDVQGVFEGWTGGGSRFTFTAYHGTDRLDYSDDPTGDGESVELGVPVRFDWGFGNDLVGARWFQPLRNAGELSLRAGYSRFDTGMSFPAFDDMSFQSRIGQVTTGIDLTLPASNAWGLKLGVQADRYDYRNRFQVGGTEGTDVDVSDENRILSGNPIALGSSFTSGAGFAAGESSAWLVGAYAQARWDSHENWLIEVGSRLESWQPAEGESVPIVTPRLAVKRFFGDRNWAIKASAGRFSQFVHSVRDESVPLGIDVWTHTGRGVPHIVSDQAQVGVEAYVAEDWFASADAYVRDFTGLVSNNFAEDPNDPLDDLISGTGDAYGLDLLLRKSGEGLTGWLSVSLMKATRTFPDVLSGLNPAPQVTYPPIFDRRLDIDLALRTPLRWGLSGSVKWNFGTGTPYTASEASYTYYETQVGRGGRLDHRFIGPPTAVGTDVGTLLGPLNGARRPAYHRLDVSVRKPLTWGSASLVPYLDIVNVYNRSNTLFYVFEHLDERRVGYSMLPFLPAIGIEVTF